MRGGRLYRSRVDCKIAGVCGGIGEYFDIDPVFVRIAAFLLTFPHGLGILAYLVCWAAIPQRPETAEEPAEEAGKAEEGGEKFVPCPNCGTMVKPTDAECFVCGAKL